jgi:hypothetical protein
MGFDGSRPKAVQVGQETLLDRDGRFQIYERETLGMAAEALRAVA